MLKKNTIIIFFSIKTKYSIVNESKSSILIIISNQMIKYFTSCVTKQFLPRHDTVQLL